MLWSVKDAMSRGVKGFVRDVAGRLLVRYASRKLRKDLDKYKSYSIEDWIEYSYSFAERLRPFPPRIRRIFSIAPVQFREEIAELLRIVAGLRPRTVLEIGTANGGTLFLLTRVAAPDALIISVDLPGGPFGGGYSAWRIPLYKAFASPGQRIELIRADSHDPRTLEEVKRVLGGRRLDFLFIDGDHTYEGVKKDFEMYAPLVRRGGIVAFHDIVKHTSERCRICGVDVFWNEIKHNYRHLEIVKDWNQGWAGIGALYV